MQVLPTRAGRRSLAQTIVILTATAVLGACGDEATAPVSALGAAPRAAQAEAAAPAPEQFETKVELAILDKQIFFNTSTGYVVVRAAVSCSAYEIFDVVLEVQQDRKNGGQASTVVGTATREDVDCTDGSASFSLSVAPQGGTFVTGNATVTARIANYQPWVIPTEVKRRVRMSA